MATPPASYGYPKAAITADKLPIWQQPLARFTVGGARDWKVSSLASIDRGVRVEAGTGSGDAVTDVTFEYETMSLPSPNIASRWSLIVRRRNWSGTGTSKLVAIPGTATKALPTRKDVPGAESDQPLALVRVTQKDTTVQEIIDLRCWASNGGVEIADRLALGYLATPGATVKLGTSTWRYERQGNDVWGWSEQTEIPFAMYAQSAVLKVGVTGNGQAGPFPHIFPAGRFTQPPIVVFGGSNARHSYAANDITTRGFNLYIRNDSDLPSLPGGIIWFIAAQMTPGSAAG